ncbi:MAG: hypothetical protein E7534_06420 [Ruminococcaceae bacterium]|nr:hypothetical protein [Oscillospiraceae bacterium]
MRGKRWLALVLTVLLALPLSLLTGCDAISVEDVKADPMKFVEDGFKLSIGNTPLAVLQNENDKMSVAVEGNFEGAELDFKLAMDELAKKCVLDLAFESESAAFAGSMYYNGNAIAVKSDFLKDLFGTDTVGMDIHVTLESLKKSPLFLSLLEISGMSAEEFEASLKEVIDFEALEKALKDLEKYTGDLPKDFNKVTGVAEETVVIDGVEIDTIVITSEWDKEAYEDAVKKLSDLMKDLTKAAGGEQTDIDNAGLQISTAPTVATTKYYLAAKTGALVKVTSESTVEQEAGKETVKTESAYTVTFGATPEVMFMPAFTVDVKQKDLTFAIDGKSSIVDGELVIAGDAKLDAGETEKEGSYKLAVDVHGDYVLTFFDKDGKESDMLVRGTIESDENSFELSCRLIEGDKNRGILSISVTYGEDVPDVPEYKDLLGLTQDELLPILQMFGMQPAVDDAFFYEEVLRLAEVDEAALDAHLATYADEGFESEQEFLYYTYADCVYVDLYYTYGVSQEELDAIVQGVIDEGGTTQDLALTMMYAYEAYTTEEA